MPSRPAVIGSQAKTRRSVTEFGSAEHVASGLYQAANAQDRIKHWQEHGAASALPPDAVSVRSAPRSETCTTPDPARSVADEFDDHSTNVKEDQRRTRRITIKRNEEASRVRSSSTPKKRVVSDEHWKSGRDSARSSKRDIRSEEPVVESTEEAAHDSPLSNIRTPKSIEKARSEREERRRRRTVAKSRDTTPKPVDQSGTNSHGTSRPSAHPRTDEPLSHAYQPTLIEQWQAGLQADDPPVARDSLYVEMDRDLSIDDEDDNRPWEKTKYAETLGRPPPTYHDAQLKSKKGTFLNKTKEVLGIADTMPVPSNRLPSIEAWLDDQPDPFVEVTIPKVRFKDESKKSDETCPPRKASKKRETTLDPNKIWDSISTFVESEAPSSNTPDDDKVLNHGKTSQPESPTSNGLKRCRAKTSRTKRHTLLHIPHEAGHIQPEDIYSDLEKNAIPEQPSKMLPLKTERPKLATIASVETLQEQTTAFVDVPVANQSVPKDKVISHDEMMTVLSRPSLRKSTRRKHSIKITNHEQKVDSVQQILTSLAEDEAKYARELKTLVDGVIPVLLQCVLSKSDSAAAAGFFTTSVNTNHDLSFSRPVIEMGVALERLKTLHNRIPLHNVDSLFSWCQTAHKAYSDYLKAWRLAFQDVVINLAPLEGPDGENNEVMARDENGDIVNADGETVDIAYLMKRPLVNIRKLGRALSCLHEELPNHPVAGKIADDFCELTAAAKTKHQQEKGRLEDEAAADIDASKCRDIRTMAPLPGASIERTRRVRARDCFNLTLFHSTGQRMDCKIELILRDNHQNAPDGGDLLICQIEQSGKWLLFAPAELNYVSARKGESGCDLVLMIRGRAGLGQEWHELLALQADEPEAIAEWMIMLGSKPLPPKLSRVPSFVAVRSQEPPPNALGSPAPARATLEILQSLETIDVPIGEPSVLETSVSKEGMPKKDANFSTSKAATESDSTAPKPPPKLSMGGGLQQKNLPEHWQHQSPSIPPKSPAKSVYPSDRSAISGYSAKSGSTYAPSSLAPMKPVTVQSQEYTERQTDKAAIQPKKPSLPERKLESSATFSAANRSSANKENDPLSVETRASSNRKKVEQSSRESVANTRLKSNVQDVSSTPNNSPAPTSRVRGNSSSNVPLTDVIRESWSAISGFGRKAESQPSTSIAKQKDGQREQSAEDLPFTKSDKVEDLDPSNFELQDVVPPAPPQHKNVPILGSRSRNTPVLRPSEAQKKMDRESGRTSFSPLRKEYTPSLASASDDSASELSLDSESDDSQTSEESCVSPIHRPAPPIVVPPKHYPPIAGQFRTIPTTGTRTLAPSDSASQGPYRRVPSSADRPDVTRKLAVAMICSWSDSGMWEPLVEGYCSIVVTPGLMETFLMHEAHANPPEKVQRPLAGFELTPMVPLRRPTGLDINIRSPPTPESQIKTSNNIMFRSRTAADCENLYQMINWSRCNNPTYIELERSRPRPQPAVSFSNQQAPRPRSWFSFGGGMQRRNSYRVGNIPPSSMGESQATTNTVSSAMSALKRLTKSSSFNVNRSSVIRRPGLSTSESLYSASNDTGIESSGSTPPPSQSGMIPGKYGPNVPATSAAALNGAGMVHNMRIRLQTRHDGGWVTMGISRLTILPAVNHDSKSPEVSRPSSSSSNGPIGEEQSRRASTTTGSAEAQKRQFRLSSSKYTPHRLHGGGREKRIVVTADKDPSRVLLDVTLGESCFEKLSQLGIAVQVWRADDEVRSRGGVVMGQNMKYLFQFFSAKECAWVFELVGKYRYGNTMAN